MTLKQLTNYIKSVADAQPNSFAGIGDVYYILNTPKSEQYSQIVITPMKIDETTDFRYYHYVIYYIDRELEDRSNQLHIQSTGVEVLSNVIRTVAEGIEIAVPKVRYTLFEEKFNSLCSGVYANVVFEASIDAICPEYYE